MKSSQLNEMNKLELESKLSDNMEALQNLRFQQALQQLEDGTMISKIKKEIAQIKTVGRILQNKQNICSAFAYVEKISRPKILTCNIFKMNSFSKSRAENFIFLQNYTYRFNLNHLE